MRQQEGTIVKVGEGVQELTEKPVGAKDRIKAAELLAKRYGLLTERTELSGVSQVRIVDDLGSDPGDG